MVWLRCFFGILFLAAGMEAQAQAYEEPEYTEPEDLSYMSGLTSYISGNKNLARSYFTASCNGGYAAGCFILASMIEKGEGGSVDLPLARKVYAKACDGGIAKGCNILGAMFAKGIGGTVDNVKAQTYFKKACALGNKKACSS
jgi:TPR repeat protein